MELTIKEVDSGSVGDIGRCDGEFMIDSKLVLSVLENEIHYTVTSLPSSKKRYSEDNVDYTTYINDPDKTIFLAYDNEQIAGQIILRKNWNGYAYIEDIAVDVKFRRIGVGRRLISHAEVWARQGGLPGIMLETQNNNVRACKFYESCGFRLRGFDTYLYKALTSGTEEIALYWYYVFESGFTR